MSRRWQFNLGRLFWMLFVSVLISALALCGKLAIEAQSVEQRGGFAHELVPFGTPPHWSAIPFGTLVCYGTPVWLFLALHAIRWFNAGRDESE